MGVKMYLLVITLAGIFSSLPTARGDDNADAVKAVVAFARAKAEASLPKAEVLVQALESGNDEAAKKAYLALRPGYEEIEHLYQVFGDTDSDIDARPYAYPYGEAYSPKLTAIPGAVFKGSHRIETLLFRDNDTATALPWAKQMITDYKTLIQKLEDDTSYSPEQIMHGVSELAYEVAKKKFSSEEETWSDLSILIFYHNLEGIKQMVAPWGAVLEQKDPETAEQLSAALAAANKTLEPLVQREKGDLVGYAPYSEVDVPTRRAIQKSFYDVGLAVENAAEDLGIVLDTGDNGGEAEAEGEAAADEEECIPTTKTAVYDETSDEIQAGLAYFKALIPFAIQSAENLTAALESGDLANAKEAYKEARPIYEQIEVLAVSFPSIDEALDAREYVYFRGELDDAFRGYHRVERHIFGDQNITQDTIDYSNNIESSLKALDEVLNNPSSDFSGVSTFEGVAGLATEVPSKKFSSEEETSSDLSLLIFYNNWKGILSQAYPFCDSAKSECDALIQSIVAAVECLDLNLEDDVLAVNASDVTEQSVQKLLKADYKAYSQADTTQRQCIVNKGYAVRDAVVSMGNALNLFDDCSPFYSQKFLKYPMSDIDIDTAQYDSSADSEAGEASLQEGVEAESGSTTAMAMVLSTLIWPIILAFSFF